MNYARDWRRHAGVDHRGVFSTYTLLTTVVNGSENNGLHQAFYLNVWECVYYTRSSAASIQMVRNMAGSSGAAATVCNLFTNYSASMQELLVLSCVVHRVLRLVFDIQPSARCVCHDGAMTVHRPSLTSAGLRYPSAYHLLPFGGKMMRSKTPFGCWPAANQYELYLSSPVRPLYCWPGNNQI